MLARVLAAAAIWLAGAASAAAQPAFPESLEREPLIQWLKRETDITPESVVAVTPQALTAIVSSFPAGGGQGPRVVVRAEALNPDTYARTGALSWHVSMTADCQGRRVRLGETTGYPERNLLGERRMLRPAETEWRKPQPGTALENALRAACDKDFRGPLKGDAVQVSPSDASASAPAVLGVRPPPAKVAKPTKAAPARQPDGGLAVQVGASASEAGARALLSSLAAQVGGRRTWVETATVDGRVWRRALVGGFADGAEAARFCAGFKAAGRPCFIRTAKPG